TYPTPDRPNEHVVRVTRGKAPARLPAVSRTTPRKRPRLGGGDYAAETGASRLPRALKVELLEEGVSHEQSSHRLWALEGLAGMDGALFRRRLVDTLGRHPSDAAGAILLVERSGDPACWDALAAATTRAPFEERTGIIRARGTRAPPDRPDPIRRERLRFLVRFLDDRTSERTEMEWCDGIEVRDFAASQLAGLLGFRVRRNLAYIIVQ